MGIIEFMVIALVVGLVVWLIQAYTPIDAKFKTLIL